MTLIQNRFESGIVIQSFVRDRQTDRQTDKQTRLFYIYRWITTLLILYLRCFYSRRIQLHWLGRTQRPHC